MSANESADKTICEGIDVAEAIVDAANKMEMPRGHVHWELDKSWFRTASGSPIARDTVRVAAWSCSEQEIASYDAAKNCVVTSLNVNEVEGRLALEVGDDGTVHVEVTEVDSKQLNGKTLQDVSQFLTDALGGTLAEDAFTVEVRGTRPAYSEDRDRGRGRDRDRGRGRDRDRGGDRGRGRDRDRGRDRRGGDGNGRTSSSDESALRRMAEKIAARVLDSGEPEQVRRELNSFERRVIHVTIEDMDGVKSRSVEEDGGKILEVYAD